MYLAVVLVVKLIADDWDEQAAGHHYQEGEVPPEASHCRALMSQGLTADNIED